MYTYVRVSTDKTPCSSFTVHRWYTQTLPAVAVAMILVGLWTWTDLEVKRLQVSHYLKGVSAYSNLPIP
jgi:hypothetical protein